ncbi:MAG: hypothetical protein ACRCYO_16915 [Bacteroidia bacterium]
MPDTSENPHDSLPKYLKNFWRGYQVYDSASNRFVDASEADLELLKNYPKAKSKGAWLNGTRLTILAAKLNYAINEPVRIGHVVEETNLGRELYIMGPKKVSDEYVQDVLETYTSINPEGRYPWLPLVYDGKALPAPNVDYNFDITEYRFEKAGVYTIQWRPGKYRSNTLTIIIN